MPFLFQQCPHPISDHVSPTSCPAFKLTSDSAASNSGKTQTSPPTISAFLLPSPDVPSPLSFHKILEDRTTSILYLPPLLSRLPVNTPCPTPISAHSPDSEQHAGFSFESPTVSLTHSRLPNIDDASIALHYALMKFRPTTENYYYLPYADSFNWNELVLPAGIQREWYIVAFRSTRAKDSPSTSLYAADRAAHEEAVSAGGLLCYWFGLPNDQGANLATCIWQSRADAVAASSNTKHIQAMKLASSMYANYDLERYVLKKVRGEHGVRVLEWQGGEVEQE